MWRAEKTGMFWYCVRTEFRVHDAFLCRTESHARACAAALNALEKTEWL